MYRPDLNPIEQAFSPVKSELRRRESRAVDALWAAVGQSLDWVTAAQARNYFRHAGYKLE